MRTNVLCYESWDVIRAKEAAASKRRKAMLLTAYLVLLNLALAPFGYRAARELWALFHP